jgi:hypothetical protein
MAVLLDALAALVDVLAVTLDALPEKRTYNRRIRH